ncbi:MAG: zinc-binding dehydrogenase [Streptosporangiales bacterium]|nr:zinc-binding dehydrogenase [Streptosporangiales bacterium]
MRCRAAVLAEPNSRMTVETVRIDEPGPGEVLVRMGAASLCHTDLEVIEGSLVYPMPIVLGHEGAGTIEAVGAGVDESRRGQRVVLSWNPHCGRCFYCEDGQPILCERYRELGGRAVAFDGTPKLHHGNSSVHTMFYIAAFAEYAVVTADCAVSIPDEMPLDRACLLGCAVLTGVGAASRIGRVTYGETVTVVGCGAVGLSAVHGARLAGAAQIVAIDRDPTRLAAASRMGATQTVDAAHQDPVEAVREITAGRGADCVVESAGNEPAFRTSVEVARVGGRIVWLGKVGVDEEVAFRWGSLMGEKQITRCSYGGARVQADIPALARSYLDGRLLLDELLTARITLDDINHGFDELRSGRAIRSVVTFDS